MSNLVCKCNHVISDGTDDLPFKGEIISDQDWEAVWGEISRLQENDKNTRSDKITGIRISHGRTAYECVKCGRLWVEEKPGSNIFLSFSPDSGAVNNILKGGI